MECWVNWVLGHRSLADPILPMLILYIDIQPLDQSNAMFWLLKLRTFCFSFFNNDTTVTSSTKPTFHTSDLLFSFISIPPQTVTVHSDSYFFVKKLQLSWTKPPESIQFVLACRSSIPAVSTCQMSVTVTNELGVSKEVLHWQSSLLNRGVVSIWHVHSFHWTGEFPDSLHYIDKIGYNQSL